MRDETGPKGGQRDVLTMLRKLLRHTGVPRFTDRKGVSARLQWALLLVLVDRSDGFVEIHEPVPSAEELADLTLSDARQIRRALAVLDEIDAIRIKASPGSRSTISIRGTFWGDAPREIEQAPLVVAARRAGVGRRRTGRADLMTIHASSLVARDGDRCAKCGRVPPTPTTDHGPRSGFWLTIDHIVPRSEGGSDELDNLQLLCSRCNGRKGNRLEPFGVTPERFAEQLNREAERLRVKASKLVAEAERRARERGEAE